MEIKAIMKLFAKTARDADGDGDVDKPFTGIARKAFDKAVAALTGEEKAELGMQPMARPSTIFECFQEFEDLENWLNPLKEKHRVVPLGQTGKREKVAIGAASRAKK